MNADAVDAVFDHMFSDETSRVALLVRQGYVIGERYADGCDEEDFARFGILNLNGGSWEGRLVISERYVKRSPYTMRAGETGATGEVTMTDKKHKASARDASVATIEASRRKVKDVGIQLRPINSLLKGSNGEPAIYWIPAYQRGYRWTPLQVTQLLDDIWEFIQHSKGQPGESFYCLQPLVMRERTEGGYEVVDGQQRLTTIYILLTYLKDLVKVMGKSRYKIHFETRGESNEHFLANVDIARANENVDFFHIAEAWKAIDSWFSDRDSSYKLTLLQHLLNADGAGDNVKVIWFELSDQDDPVAAFTRLNVGKIPLTNDELIRAQMLRKATDEDEEHGLVLRIAHEWDQIEKALQRDPFWYFLSNKSPPNHNRIGLLFELVANLSETQKQDPYGAFHFFTQKLQEERAERIWLSVKQTFMALEEWYEDRELFHVVGFLIHQGVQVSELLKAASDQRKSAFVDELRCRTFDSAIGGDLNALDEPSMKSAIQERCESISYSSDGVLKLLLLFNLATLLEDPRSNLRFQFDSFKSEHWDIEHVRSVDAKKPVRPNEQIDWLKRCEGYLETQKDEDGQELVCKIKDFSIRQNENDDSDEFDTLYDQLLQYFDEVTEGGEDGLHNLTLLDRHTNRSYKNAVFAVKRQRILELDQSGIFVPLCTRNVFLKCYSPQVGNVMFWRPQDAKDYLDAIVKTLRKFFCRSKEMPA